MTGFESKREAAADKLQEPEREALKLALEALETCGEDEWHSDDDYVMVQIYNETMVNRAITAIKEALAQPAQEPVAHVYLFDHDGRPLIAWNNAKGIKIGDKLYTAPPQREWVGLTDDEIKKIVANYCLTIGNWSLNGLSVAQAVAAKLKERNL